MQSYSLKHSRLLDPSHTHPSPPSVFALSCTSKLLLSTSTTPPTIYLTNLALKTPPILLRPQCSSSTVVAADFHPERENFFLLAFTDGTVAVFDATYFYQGPGKSRENAAVSGIGGELAFIRGIHALGAWVPTSNEAVECGVTLNGYDPGTGIVGIGSKASGITAVAFVPGLKATAVTVGADGKCCVVDFTQPTKHRALLLKSWHIRCPATSLSIICSARTLVPDRSDGSRPSHAKNHRLVTPIPSQLDGPGPRNLAGDNFCLAIGREDGRVLLFDLDGKQIGEQALDSSGARVIDVEWTQSDSSREEGGPHTKLHYRASPSSMEKKSLGTLVLNRPQIADDQGNRSPENMAEQSEESLFDFSQPIGGLFWDSSSSRSNTGALNRPTTTQPAKPILETSAANNELGPTSCSNTPCTNPTVQRTFTSNSFSNKLPESEYQQSQHKSVEHVPSPAIPPRPTPRAGGRLAMRRAQSARQSSSSVSYLGAVPIARRGCVGNSKSSRRPSPTPFANTEVFFGPRNPPVRKLDSTECDSMSSDPLLFSSSPDEPFGEAWTPVTLALPLPPRNMSEPSPKSSSTSDVSFKTASSCLDTPTGFKDTVVEWSATSTRQPLPSGEKASFSGRKPGSPSRQAVPALKITHPSGERPRKSKSKNKEHVSLPVSSTSVSIASGSCISLSSTIDDTDPIIQWPSLKKSPRIPELNKGLPDPEKYQPPSSSSKATATDSATALILEGSSYTAAPSPSKLSTPGPNHAPATVHTDYVAPGFHICDCAAALQSTVHSSLDKFRTEMTQQFEEQKNWLDEILKVREDERVRLAEENQWLRDELTRIGEGKGKERE